LHGYFLRVIAERSAGEIMKQITIALLVTALLSGCITLRSAHIVETGDVLRITFTGIPQPETHECKVNPNGNITVSVFEEVPVAGKTAKEIEVLIERQHSPNWIRSFQVHVTPVEQE
jgi:protein involved in polysaccharide export with SLBB domain